MKLTELSPDELAILKRCIDQKQPMHHALAAIADRFPEPHIESALYDEATWDRIEERIGRGNTRTDDDRGRS